MYKEREREIGESAGREARELGSEELFPILCQAAAACAAVYYLSLLQVLLRELISFRCFLSRARGFFYFRAQ